MANIQSASHPSIPRLVTTTLLATVYYTPNLENKIVNVEGADNTVTKIFTTDVVVGSDTVELKKRA